MKFAKSQIVEMLHRNDKQVIAVIYDQYAPALYGVVVRIVQSEEIAQDVMQDAFVKIWKKGTTYDSTKGTLFTWLLNITRNTAIDKIRSAGFRKSEKNQNIDNHLHNKISNRGTNPDEIGVKELLNNLDDKYRDIIDMIYFRGFTQKEVSEELGIPLGTVKTRLRIGLRELRGIFDVANVGGVFLFFNSISLL
ncbi:MAG: RNA polymerase sigma-70 factor (ECF subfamily) [Granulosicoccus sp.]|jgi:RNA polymerase sigma-70 factor (ECF subfamily)